MEAHVWVPSMLVLIAGLTQNALLSQDKVPWYDYGYITLGWLAAIGWILMAVTS
jgi:hypothetical protein